MTGEGLEMPALGKPGEPCEHCGAPLAADQRYCLECGHRRGEPRVDYREWRGASLERGGHLSSDGAERASTPQDGAAPEQRAPEGEEGGKKGERDYAPLAAVGGIAVLGLMLLVGVLIGRGDGGSAQAPAPVVVERGAGGEAGEAEGTGGEGGGGGEEGLTGGGGGNSPGSGGNGGKGGGGKEEGGGGGEEPVEASTKQLEELESESGEDAAKNALKLPDKIATPGKPPPIDKSKPPGAGEGGITIK